MAKKKSKPPKKTPKRRSRSQPEVGPELPDRRALEGAMHDLLGGMLGRREDTPLAQAQDLMDEAFESPDPKKQVKLARKALELSPDCADAYVLLAEHAKSRKEALELYEQAVVAGERALGPEVFQEEVGHFWGLLETRPYMRARERLASLLWTMGRRDEAIRHLQDMLRLNPNDNQGVRYTLAGWLLGEGRDEELAHLLNEYDEGTAAWAYTKALLAFRQNGDTPEARKLLQTAKKSNTHVPAYLLGQKLLPLHQPESYSLGSEDEAILYAATSLSGWKETPGAIAWLKESEPGAKERKAPRTKARGPLPLVKKRLQKLPRAFDVWQADFRQFGRRVEEGGELFRPWLVVVTSRTNGLIVSQTMALEPPTSDLLWTQLAEAMQKPMMGKRHRPTELQVGVDERWDELTPHLDEIGINVVPVEKLDQIDFVFEELNKAMAADQPPGLLEMPGVKPEQLAGFYQAAAEFHRKAPWRKLGYEMAIQVECAEFESSPWYAIVMGQSGMTFGVALYDDLKTLRRLWSGAMSEEENARQTVALTVTFDDKAEIPDADLDAIERYDFEVAGPGAYPSIFRKERGMSMRPPLAWELRLMEGCLRALPEFVAKHRPDDRSRHKMTVPVASGELTFTLSWIAD